MYLLEYSNMKFSEKSIVKSILFKDMILKNWFYFKEKQLYIVDYLLISNDENKNYNTQKNSLLIKSGIIVVHSGYSFL